MKQSKRIGVVVAAFFVLGLSAYAGLYGWIQWEAHQKAAAVLANYPQASNEVEALILQVQSNSETMRRRNMAVWTLGRLRAKAALPVMQKYYTGEPCEHDTRLCQDELKKAIHRCGGDI